MVDTRKEDNEHNTNHQSTSNQMTCLTTDIILSEEKKVGLLRSEAETKIASISHLEQEHQEEIKKQKQNKNQQKNLIYGKIGNTEHPAFELLPYDAPAATSKDSDSIWVKWVSNDKK